jgi:hypothetical protein
MIARLNRATRLFSIYINIIVFVLYRPIQLGDVAKSYGLVRRNLQHQFPEVFPFEKHQQRLRKLVDAHDDVFL